MAAPGSTDYILSCLYILSSDTLPSMKTYLVKVDDAMYANWQAQAKRAGVKLAELIRMRMNGNAKATAKNARRTRDTKPRGRRPGVAARPLDKSYAQMSDIERAELSQLRIRDSSGTVHDKSCQCRVCDFKRKHLK